MNTIDVRDTSAGQWLYWSIAAPLTLVVMISAYLYAYKDDFVNSKGSRNIMFQDKSQLKGRSSVETSRHAGRLWSNTLDFSQNKKRTPTFGYQRARNRADTWGTM